VEDDDAIGERADHVHLVLDEQDGAVAAALQPADEVEDHRHLVDRHAGGRLVEHHHVRLQRRHDRHLELALVAVGERRRLGVAPRREADLVERPVGALDPAAMAGPAREDLGTTRRPRLDGEADVLVGGEIGEERGDLEGPADAARRASRGAELRDVVAVEQDAARGRRDLAGHQVEIGGLAGAVGADDGGQFAGSEGGGDAVDRDVAAEADRQVVGLELGGDHRP